MKNESKIRLGMLWVASVALVTCKFAKGCQLNATRRPSIYIFINFGAICGFWAPFWAQLGPKGVPEATFLA